MGLSKFFCLCLKFNLVGPEFFSFCEQCRFSPFPFGDVADVALHHVLAVHVIDEADELRVDLPPVYCLQWQIFKLDVFLLLQFFKIIFAGSDILKNPYLPEFLAKELFMGESK